MSEPLDLVISYDITGSMSPALGQTRKNILELTKNLFSNISDLRIGLIAHNDYSDGPNCIFTIDLTSDNNKLKDFVSKSYPMGGGDAPECYELAINKARSFNWGAGREKAFLLIGDDEPHSVGYRTGFNGVNMELNKLDWKNEAKLLKEAGVSIYAIQALNVRRANYFYEGLAEIGETPKLELAQFAQVTSLIEAISYRQTGQLSVYEMLLRAKATETIDFSLLNNIDLLSGKKTKTKPTKRSDGLIPVSPSRFQFFKLSKDEVISEFVRDNGLTFKKGRGFYELTKTVLIQGSKEIIAQDLVTGEMFNGDAARKLAGLPIGSNANIKNNNNGKYAFFVQSTSANRKLLRGTRFMYEVS